MLRLASLLTICFFPGLGVHAQELPQRIVSMNLCTDQLVLLLADRTRIASLSYFAADPAYSWLAADAVGIAANHGQVEEVLAYQPDLILTSQFSATLAANLLDRLDHPVHRLDFAVNVADSAGQIRQVAALTGNAPAGEQLILALQSAIASRTQQLVPLLQNKSAVFFASNGFAYGSSSLQDSFITSLGMRNIAADAGLIGPAQLPLELLLRAAPDYIFTDTRGLVDQQLAHPMLQHPALAALQTTTFVELPDALFQCAGPQLANAYHLLAAQLADER